MIRNRLPVSLRRLFPMASFVGCSDVGVLSATQDSRECHDGMLFAAIEGSIHNGEDFIHDAVDAGATAVLLRRPNAEIGVSQCIVPNVRQAWSRLCHAMHEFPTRRMHLTGVTGTNGKTTVCWLLRSIHAALDRKTGMLGTIGYDDGNVCESAGLTTPDAQTLCAWLARMVANRTTHVAVELSSHALDQERASGTLLDIAVLTNITQDHFDYHGSFEAYRDCKRRIADLVSESGTMIVNADDPACRSIGDEFTGDSRRVLTFGLGQTADVSARVSSESLDGTTFELAVAGVGTCDVSTSLIGRHNVLNCLAAAASAHVAGVGLEHIVHGLERADAIPGRLESVEIGQPFDAFVDYAHTGDALRNVIRSVRPLAHGRLICVFGAGGDRDRGKRPQMARAASDADVMIVTSDNPRSEDPEQIIEEVRTGLNEAADARAHFETSRAAAIRLAVALAQPGDCVLVAGRGHETFQQIGDTPIPFDDRLVLRQSIEHSLQQSGPVPTRLHI